MSHCTLKGSNYNNLYDDYTVKDIEIYNKEMLGVYLLIEGLETDNQFHDYQNTILDTINSFNFVDFSFINEGNLNE